MIRILLFFLFRFSFFALLKSIPFHPSAQSSIQAARQEEEEDLTSKVEEVNNDSDTDDDDS